MDTPVAAPEAQEQLASSQSVEVKKPPAGAVTNSRGGWVLPTHDSARARELARMRWDAVSAAARRGIVDAGKNMVGINGHSPVPVVQYLVEQHTMNAADPSAPGSVQSFKQIMDLAYPKPAREPGPAVPDGGMSLSLSPELARAVLARLSSARDGR